MGWKENKNQYVTEYIKENYRKVTVQFRLDGKNEKDLALWNTIKDAKNKNELIKDLAYQGLTKDNK